MHGKKMPMVAVIGLEGSGKTVLITTLAKRLATINKSGVFLNPQSVTTMKYVENIWSLLQNGQWPPSTSPGEMFDLHWRLEVEGETECELRLVDMAGQDLRKMFGTEMHHASSAIPEHMRKLLDYCVNADILLVLVNIQDFVGSVDRERHLDNQAALKGAIDYLNRKGDKEVALLFTQYDRYEKSIEAYGGLGPFLMNEMSYIFGAHIHGKPTMTMTISAVNDTVVVADAQGRRYQAPARNFTSSGLNALTDWLLLAVSAVKDNRGILNEAEDEYAVEEADEEDEYEEETQPESPPRKRKASRKRKTDWREIVLERLRNLSFSVKAGVAIILLAVIGYAGYGFLLSRQYANEISMVLAQTAEIERTAKTKGDFFQKAYLIDLGGCPDDFSAAFNKFTEEVRNMAFRERAMSAHGVEEDNYTLAEAQLMLDQRYREMERIALSYKASVPVRF